MHIIGLRTIKTALAVFITLITKVFLVLLIGEELAFIWYTPFFAAIAAAYSMHNDVKSSLRQAQIRSMGSIIGGVYGILIVMLVEWAILPALGMGFNQNNIAVWLLSYTIYSVAIIGAITIAVHCKQAPAVFITCLTYLSVTVSIRNGGQPFITFGINRIISTIYGVFVAVGVNMIKMPKRKNRNVLFISDLDSLLTRQKQLSPYMVFTLNSLISRGANMSFTTTRTPSSLNRIFSGVKLNLPVVTMNGAAVFDFKNNKYSNVQIIPKSVSNNIDNYLAIKKIGAFTYTIVEDVLAIYVTNLSHDEEIKFYHNHKNSYFKNYINGNVPENQEVSYYLIINTLDVINNILADLKILCGDEIITNVYPHDNGYYKLKIQDNEANKIDAINALGLKEKADLTVAFGKEIYDIPMLRTADLSICMENSPTEVKNECNIVIVGNNPDRIAKMMRKIYFSRDISKLLNRKDCK